MDHCKEKVFLYTFCVNQDNQQQFSVTHCKQQIQWFHLMCKNEYAGQGQERQTNCLTLVKLVRLTFLIYEHLSYVHHTTHFKLSA